MMIGFSSTRIFSLLVLAVLLSACASEQKVTKTQVKKDWRGRVVPFSVGKDKDGNPVMKSDKRSSLEGKRNADFAGRDFSGENYTTQSYRKKRWFGNTEYGKKRYDGNTDASQYQREPWYVRKQASASGQLANAHGKKFWVNPFRKKTANEQNSSRLARPSDAETDTRRGVFPQPEVTHWKKQGGLSVDDTKRMLGR